MYDDSSICLGLLSLHCLLINGYKLVEQNCKSKSTISRKLHSNTTHLRNILRHNRGPRMDYCLIQYDHILRSIGQLHVETTYQIKHSSIKTIKTYVSKTLKKSSESNQKSYQNTCEGTLSLSQAEPSCFPVPVGPQKSNLIRCLMQCCRT